MYRLTIEYYSPSDPEKFDTHYRDNHIPLVLALPGLARLTTSSPRGLGGHAPYLVAELWFDDAEALKSALGSSEMATTAADAKTFEVASTIMFSGEVVDVG